MYKSYLNMNNLPRGIRNNNPGNLVRSNNAWLGKIPYNQSLDSKFEQFIELRYGIRALMRDIYSDHKKGLTTVTDLISEFAPAFENHTEAYINSVIDSVGSNAIPELTEDILIKLAKAIVKVENGNTFTSYINDSDYKEALAISGLRLKKK